MFYIWPDFKWMNCKFFWSIIVKIYCIKKILLDCILGLLKAISRFPDRKLIFPQPGKEYAEGACETLKKDPAGERILTDSTQRARRANTSEGVYEWENMNERTKGGLEEKYHATSSEIRFFLSLIIFGYY